MSGSESIDMLVEVFNLLAILVGGAESCRVGDVTHRSTRLAHRLDDTGEVLIVGTSCILGIELHILYVALGILHCRYGTLDNLLGSAVELILDVRGAGADTCMYTLVLGILERLGCYVDILLHGTGERTYRGPCHGLGNLDDRVEVARA